MPTCKGCKQLRPLNEMGLCETCFAQAVARRAAGDAYQALQERSADVEAERDRLRQERDRLREACAATRSYLMHGMTGDLCGLCAVRGGHDEACLIPMIDAALSGEEESE